MKETNKTFTSVNVFLSQNRSAKEIKFLRSELQN